MAYTKLKDKPLAFIDLETSGLDPYLHEILEFAAIKGDDKLVLKIEPRRIHTASPKALEVNGYDAAEWLNEGWDYKVAALTIHRFLRDSVIVAHNVRFDTSFVEMLFYEAGIREQVIYHTLDTITLAYEHLVPQGLESLSLHNVCKFLDIPPEPTKHRALAGATACKAVYERLMGVVE